MAFLLFSAVKSPAEGEQRQAGERSRIQLEQPMKEKAWIATASGPS